MAQAESAAEAVDCIVVGAGASGLQAALGLKAAGKSVLVLEARDRVGGRLKRGILAGHSVDLGGMWLGPSQKRLSGLANHYGLATYATHLSGRNSVGIAGRTASEPGEEASRALGIAAGLDYQRTLARMTALTAGLSPAEVQESPALAELDGWSVAAWLKRHAASRVSRAAFAFQVRALLCAEPEDVSMRFFLFYLMSGDGASVILAAGPGGAQNFAFRGGLVQVPERMASDLGPLIRLNAPVQAIEQDADGVKVRCGSESLAARHIIVALPPALAGRIDYNPMLPQQREALTQRMAMGSVIKVWIAYRRPFWRDAGFNGFGMFDDQPFTPWFDVSVPDRPEGLIVGFYDAGQARIWSEKGMEARRAEALRQLAACYGPEALQPNDYLDQDWTAERWSRGCYGGFGPPGLLNACAPALRAPVGRIHWAGTESSLEWCGYVEGALAAGERAAAEVIAALG